MLTPDEVARLLRTSRAGVYAAAARGSIPRPTRIGRRVLFAEDALLRFLATGRPEEPPMPPTIAPAAPPELATAVAPPKDDEAPQRIDPLLRARARRALRR